MIDNEEQFFKEHQNLLYGFIRYYNLDEDEYYDLILLSFIQAMRKYNESKGNFSTFFYKVALNDICKAKKRENNLSKIPKENILSYNLPISKDGEDEYINFIQDETVDVANQVEQKLLLQQIFDSLTSLEKQVLYLYFVKEKSCRQIALKFNISFQYVSELISKARSRILSKFPNVLES